jgi:ectoine hydroxylase-related dioxygenase (phytanoyl-CoA dioxygenase family)
MATRAVHIWVPLQDATEENGCLRYLPGSHRHGLNKHVTSLRTGGLIQRTTLADESTALPCPVRLGGLVAHSPMTLHASNPNRSAEVRRAWVLQFGIGPWVAMRHLARPALVAVARTQIALSRMKLPHSDVVEEQAIYTWLKGRTSRS